MFLSNLNLPQHQCDNHAKTIFIFIFIGLCFSSTGSDMLQRQTIAVGRPARRQKPTEDPGI
jgi:hypothetical protein